MRSPPSQSTPTPVRVSRKESLSRTPSTNPSWKRKHAEIVYEECDGEFERRIEDAMIELGRLRTLVDAKTVEINVLISQRFSRLKVSSLFFSVGSTKYSLKIDQMFRMF